MQKVRINIFDMWALINFNSKVSCLAGRRGSFEVKINDVLVHSKLQTIAFPVHEDIADNVKNCFEGKELRPVAQQKITDCCIS